jgi:hypothetical protein
LPSVDDVETALVPGVIQVLAAYVSQHAAEDYAYEYLRRYFNSKDAHQAMILSVLLAKQGKKRRDPDIVQVDTAACYEDCQNGAKTWVIIESGPNPDLARNEYAPTHDLAERVNTFETLAGGI